jgi:type I restriction enzyme S subunit
LDLQSCRFVDIDPNDVEARRTRLARGDLLVSITADIGIIGYIDESVPSPAYINQHIARVRLDRSLADSRFVAYFLASWEPQRHFVGATDTGAKAGMNLATVATLSTVVPPLPEQRRIAEALDDVDSLISMLERKLDKQQAVKQGMVQELLSGRTRLPGFGDRWPEVALASVATGLRGSGLSKKQLDPSGLYPCLLYGELFTTYGRRIDRVRSRTNTETSVQSEAGDVLIPGSTTTVARDLATASAIHVSGVLIGGDTNVVRPEPSLSSDWLAYYITYQLRDRVAEVAQGLTIKHLYVRDLLQCSIVLPPLAEQRAIVDALADAEAETSVLHERLEKTRLIKNGMMQELLTGHTRLRVTEGAG